MIDQKIKKSADPKAQVLGSACVRLRENKSAAAEEWVDAQIVFVKDRHSKDWLALLCMDLELSDEEIVRLYGKHWNIEVFFKVFKSHLALAKPKSFRATAMICRWLRQPSFFSGRPCWPLKHVRIRMIGHSKTCFIFSKRKWLISSCPLH